MFDDSGELIYVYFDVSVDADTTLPKGAHSIIALSAFAYTPSSMVIVAG